MSVISDSEVEGTVLSRRKHHHLVGTAGANRLSPLNDEDSRRQACTVVKVDGHGQCRAVQRANSRGDRRPLIGGCVPASRRISAGIECHEQGQAEDA